MTPDQWQRVKSIAYDALGIPVPQRVAFVAASCGDDELLQREVTSLLEAAIAATDLFETPALTTQGAQAILADTDRLSNSLVGRRVGPYRIVSEIGRGGMGAAYLAERADDAFRKRVAIKLIKRGMDTDAIVRRFLHERQLLANLNHPNIAMLLDGGSTDEGLPYFIMEFVEGLPIDAFCQEKRLTIRARLELFRAVCDAVQYAHENRVIHRDLKPGNILVTREGVPKLLDFGIAKLLDVEQTQQTGEGTLLARAMTPRYASPEQVRGEPITVASDVYSLGVLLYELLAGQPPFELRGLARGEAERLVCAEMPPAPSRTAPHLRHDLSGNLDAIVLTCLRKEPNRRYASVTALANDIDRHLNGLPVAARADRFGSQVASLVRRHRALWPAFAAVVAIVAAVLAVPRLRVIPAGNETPTSIAVLPLATSGGGPDLEYLSDGITETLIRQLSRASNVRVIARDSSYRYKGKVVDPQQVARDLGVQAIVTGRVVSRGSDLTLSVELVDTRDRRQLWGERYSRTVSDVQSIQADLSHQIANALRLQFSSQDGLRIARDDIRDPEAYELYLKGRYFWNRRTIGDFEKSIAYFRQAVEKDPSFALAYAGLADSFSLLTEYHGASARDTYDEARRAAERALALDGELAEAHTSVAYIKQFYEWDFDGAEKSFKRALELNPRYATARQWYAEFLSATGRHDEAIAAIRLAADVDPLSLIVNAVEANLLYMARRYDEAIEQCLEVIDMDPNFPEVYEYLKRSLDQKGAYKDAIAARQTRRRLLGRNINDTEALQTAATTTSHVIYWQSRLVQELEESKQEGLQAFEMAEITGQAGDILGALQWLEQACRDNDFMTMYMRVAPNLDPLRGERRYRALLARGCRV